MSVSLSLVDNIIVEHGLLKRDIRVIKIGYDYGLVLLGRKSVILSPS